MTERSGRDIRDSLRSRKRRFALGTAAVLAGLWLMQEISPVHPTLYRTNEMLALQASGRFGQKAEGTLIDYVPEARRSAQMEEMLRRQLGQVDGANLRMRLVSVTASLDGRFWFPLRKTSICRFILRFDQGEFGPIEVGGQLQTTTTGLLSGSNLKEHIGNKISRSLRATIGRDLAGSKARVAGA